MMRIGVIGYGYWGPNLVRNFFKREDCRVVALADRDAERLGQAQRLYPRLEVHRDVDELFKRGDLDAVVVATPMATHYNLARRALEQGLHVLVEKPMTASVSEANELVRLAEERRLVLMVDHTFIYTGAVRKLREVIDSGDLGDIFYYDSVRVNLGLFQQDLNVLWDLAPHDFSIMDYLIDDKPTGISAVGANPLQRRGYSLESVAYVNVEFGQQALAHFHVNWLSPVKVRRTLIGGSRKMAIYDPLEPDEQIKIVDKGVEIIREEEERYRTLIQYRTGDMWVPKIDQTEALANVAGHFVECIREGRTPLTDGRAGLRVVRLLEAAQDSIDSQKAMQPLAAGGESVQGSALGLHQ